MRRTTIAFVAALLLAVSSFAQPAEVRVPAGRTLTATLQETTSKVRVVAGVQVDLVVEDVRSSCAGPTPCDAADRRSQSFVMRVRNAGTTRATGVGVRPGGPSLCLSGQTCPEGDYVISLWRDSCTFGECTPCPAGGPEGSRGLECPDSVIEPGDVREFEIVVGPNAGKPSVQPTVGGDCASSKGGGMLLVQAKEPDARPADNVAKVPVPDVGSLPTLRFATDGGPPWPARVAQIRPGERYWVEAKVPRPLCGEPPLVRLTAQGDFSSRPTRESLESVGGDGLLYRTATRRLDEGDFFWASKLPPRNGELLAEVVGQPDAWVSTQIVADGGTIILRAFDPSLRPTTERTIPQGGAFQVELTYADVRSPTALAPEHRVMINVHEQPSDRHAAIWPVPVHPDKERPGTFVSDLLLGGGVGRVYVDTRFTAHHLFATPAFTGAHVVEMEAARGVVTIELTNQADATESVAPWTADNVLVGDSFRIAAKSLPPDVDVPSVDFIIHVERPRVGPVAERRLPGKRSADGTYLTETIVAAPASILGDLRPGDRLRASAPALNAASGWTVVRPIAKALAMFRLDVVGSSPAGTVALDEAVRVRVAHALQPTSSHPDVIADLEVHRNGIAITSRPVVLKPTANGFFASAPIALGGPTPEIDVQAGEVLVATYSLDPEKDRFRTLPLYVVAPRPIVSEFALESLGSDGGRLEARTVTPGGQMRLVTTFKRPPDAAEVEAELRTRRGGATTKELLVTLARSATDPMRYESLPIALAGDGRLAHVRPGDRLEARYESDRWAATPMAALGVIGRPGVVRAIRVIGSTPPGREVSEVVASRAASRTPIGLSDSPYLLQVEFEAPPEERSIWIRVETGPPAAEGAPVRSGHKIAGVTERTYRADATPTATIFQTDERLRISGGAGHRLIATFGSARLNLPVVAGALEAGNGRLNVVAPDAFGQPTAVSVVIRSGETLAWTTGNTTVDLPAGDHEVVFSYPFGSYTTRASVVAGQTTTVRANGDVLGVLRFDLRDALRKQVRPRTSAERIGTAPAGWTIGTRSNSVEADQAPASIQVPAGRYQVYVGAPIDRKFDVVVSAGGTTTLSDPSPRGRLTPTAVSFAGGPLTCAVLVKGSAREWKTRCAESIDIPPGDVTVEFTGDGYRYRLEARVAEGQEVRVSMPRLGRLRTKSLDAVGNPRDYVQITPAADPTSRHSARANAAEPTLLPAGEYTVRFDPTDTVVRVRIQGGQTTLAEDPTARTLARLRVHVPREVAAESGGPNFDVEVWRGSELVAKRAGAHSPIAMDVVAGTYEVRLLRFIWSSLSESKAVYIAIPNVTLRAGDNPPVQPREYGRLEVEIRDKNGAPLPDRIGIVAESGRDPDAASRGQDIRGRGLPNQSRQVLFLNPGRYLVGSDRAAQKPVTVSPGKTTTITLIGRD